MSIEFSCECGRDLFLRDELAGKQIRCPDCQRTITVPYASQPRPFAEAPPPVAETPAYDSLGERSEERRPEPERPPDDSQPRPMAPRSRPPSLAPGGRGVNSAAIVGGLALILAGGVLIATQACGGRILPYVFIFMGIVSIVKGLLGVRDSD